MLTANEYINIEDYAFKSSPESCSGNSCFTDCTDLPSDEDFLQQLSSDLDIPLLLNPGEDEMSLLSSFFDKSPEEIMSEILSPSPKFDENADNCGEIEHPKLSSDLHSEIKIETDNHSSSSSNKSHSPIHSPNDGVKFFEIKDEVKNEPHSPEAITVPVHSTEIDSNILISTIANNQIRIVSPITTQAKKVPIPKITASSTQKNKILKTEKRTATALGANVLNSPPQKVVVLENITAVPVTTIAQIPSTTLNNSVINTCTVPPPVILKGNDNMAVNVNNIDPKILKRHQRRIKNRESACLSRKKKKDYVTSLEMQVKEISEENHKLKMENQQLKERLMKYEGKPVQKGSSNVKNNIVLCMFLFSVAFHLDYVRNPFFAKNSDFMETNKPKVPDHHGRNLLWAPDESLDKNGSNFLPFSMCPASINQTESARLALELERWIGQPKESLNKSQTANDTGVTTSRTKPLRKRKQKKYHTTILSSIYENHSVGEKLGSGGSNEIQVFSPTAEQLYREFFEAINRQDDTFYVVSFSDHHMLLPALHHNKTRRPKMSLIMPSVLPNENITHPTLVPLMQIDCEVLDTRLIQIRYGSIPQHLRRNGNFSTYQNDDSVSKPSEPSTNYTTRKAYKPYFIKQKTVRSDEDREFYNIR